MSDKAVLSAVAKLVATEVKKLQVRIEILETQNAVSASPVEMHGTNVADDLLDELKGFNCKTPVFGQGSKATNPIVEMSWKSLIG